MKHGLGVVIGKFYPPHRGHKLLIDTATEQSDQTVVIVCAKPTDSIPGELRGQWLQEIHPKRRVMVIDDRYDENDSRIWAENTVRWLGRAPDAVFTSEDYGDRYAALMGSKHVSVDRAKPGAHLRNGGAQGSVCELGLSRTAGPRLVRQAGLRGWSGVHRHHDTGQDVGGALGDRLGGGIRPGVFRAETGEE